MMCDAGVKRVNLKNIGVDSENILIVGIIIAKRSPRSFNSRRDGRECGVWGFTFRDSPADYINVTVWGSPPYVTNLSDLYSVGDVIDITNPRISLRRISEKEDRYQPPVTSCFDIALSEDRSEICLHDEEDVTEFKKLLFLPTKPPSNFLTLADVTSNQKYLSGQFINILVAVQRVLEPREILAKDGRHLKLLEMYVMDRTDSGFFIQSWNPETISRSQSWKPRSTVIFVSDVIVEWDCFKRRMRGSVGDRAVITENPRTKEATLLAEFIKNTPSCSLVIDSVCSTIPHPDSITNVMSCHSVMKKAISQETAEDFTALVYATLTSFDFDSDSAIINKCSVCGQRTDSICKNEECPITDEESKITATFDLRLKLVDYTGSLSFCRLSSRTAEKSLSVTVEEYLLMNENEKLNIKWKYLLKPVAARLLIRPADNSDRLPSLSVIDIKPISMAEFTLKIPVF